MTSVTVESVESSASYAPVFGDNYTFWDLVFRSKKKEKVQKTNGFGWEFSLFPEKMQLLQGGVSVQQPQNHRPSHLPGDLWIERSNFVQLKSQMTLQEPLTW